MWNKLKDFLGLDEILADEPIQEPKQKNSNLIDVRALQIENQLLKEEIRLKNELLNELSQDNMSLGIQCQGYAEKVYDQQKLINVYQDMEG
jgi:hypothetical protein|nr:MAG TPA: hypothetical protein [Caudoviricetes sp.]